MKNTKEKATIGAIAICFLIYFAFYGFEAYSRENAAPQTEYHDTVIVGAGISGLTCGYFLKDTDVVILEKNTVVGGRTISNIHKNFTYAKGTEYLGKSEEHLAQMLHELNLIPKEIPSPMDAYFDGKRFYYGGDGIRSYLVKNGKQGEEEYKRFAKLLANEYRHYKEVPQLQYDEQTRALDQISAKQWLEENGFSEAYLQKYNVTSKGLFGAALDEISALSFIPEAAFDYEHDAPLTSPFEAEESSAEEYAAATREKSRAYSFATGLTELTNKLGQVLNDKIKLNSTVTEVRKTETGYSILYRTASGQECAMTAKKVVLAVPAPIALTIGAPVISAEKAAIMKQIRYSSYATIALFSDEAIFDKAFDLAVPDGYVFTDLYDATWIEKHYAKTSQENAHILSVYIAPPRSSDHSLDRISDQELLTSVYRDLDRVFPQASRTVTGYDIERFPYAYPVMTLGAYQRLLKLDELNQGSLILAGDYLIYPTFEAAVESGYFAAQKIKAVN